MADLRALGLDKSAVDALSNTSNGNGNSGRDMSTLKSMLEGMASKGAASGRLDGEGYGRLAGSSEAAEKEGDNEKWRWQQRGDELHVQFPSETKVTKKDVVVKFRRASLQVRVQEVTYVNADLFGAIETDECTRCLSPDFRELQVMLTKKSPADWPRLFASKPAHAVAPC